MSRYMIEIDDEVINEQITRILDANVKQYLHHICNFPNATMADAVKEIVYSHKEEIIETVVERATREITKKGLPKLLERYSGE